jgi:hypothetical protein
MRKPVCCFSIILAMLISTLFTSVLAVQQSDDTKWTQWSKKDAEKILSSSPWSQTQNETDTSEMFFSPTGTPTSRPGANDEDRLKQGATNQAVNVKYSVRFFSARPVRRALARLIELNQDPPKEVVEKLHSFADMIASDSIIITLTVQASDQRAERAVMQAINSAVTATLKNETYLERNGKRLFLEEYVPPGKDGFGARFIFLREMDAAPFIAENTGEVRFLAKFPNGPKIDRKFKVSEMMYNGALEY